MSRKRNSRSYGLCVNNEGYAASLELRKIYRMERDAKAEQLKMVRVVDESGESYLYPSGWFVPIEIPTAAEKVFAGSP